MKKALLILILCLFTAFTLISCNGDENEQPAVTYTVSWMDENGNKLSSTTVNEGEVPSYTYTVTDTAEWDYTFEGWATSKGGETLTEIPAASTDATYYAVVSAVKQKYTVKFNTVGGSEVASETVEYGQCVSIPEPPKYEGHRFVGWSYTEGGTDAVDFEKAITGNTEYFAIWNETVDVKALLAALLEGYKLDPMSYIPESMRSDFSANLVNESDIVTDYSGFTDISDIALGFGEQWHMVLDNLNQSMIFFNTLSVVEGLTTASITAFNNYFDKNPADTAHHEFESGTYNVTVDFDGEIIVYALDYTANIPALGEQTVQIALAMNVDTAERTARIQIGDANALKYTIGADYYEFAIKYLGIRRAMFSVSKDTLGNVSGHIYEYLTAASIEIGSAADFYITDDYVSVVGNKASGMVGFTGTISELYTADNGKMVGYEVNEKLSVVNYDTLWFNLADINGLESIKYDGEKFYVNGSASAWQAKKNTLTRRFDIEMRKQYVYSYDAENEKYVMHEIEVPMIFVQEGNFDTFAADVSSTNGITVSVSVNSTDFAKLTSDYDTLIPVFVANKDKMTTDLIIAYIGEKIAFD